MQYIVSIKPNDLKQAEFVVFLATPSYAAWLHDNQDFVGKALHRLYADFITQSRDDETPDPIQVLCAVVDRLPVTSAQNAGVELSGTAVGSHTYPGAGAGLEGLAYVTLPVSASVSSTIQSNPEKGAIDFRLAEGTTDTSITMCDTLRMPLANTVFQTGTPTSMSLSTWNIHPRHATNEPLELVTKNQISHHAIRLTEATKPISPLASTFSIPLLPLTLPRRVEGCMGNIIRRLTDSDGKDVTASAELEDVVPRFFKSRREPAQSTTAWALVMPNSMKASIDAETKKLLEETPGESEQENGPDRRWEDLWASDPPHFNSLVSTAIADGARLHRVLSGGGGWGKKAGLLSLDPVPVTDFAYGEQEQSETDASYDDPQDFASSLTSVVLDGDWIQFFILPNSYLNTEAAWLDSEEHIKSLQPEESLSWELGTIPSTVDSIPGQSWQHAAGASEDASVFRNSFGALTEAGLTLTRRPISKLPRSSDSTSTSATTVDVPFTRIRSVQKTEQGRRDATADVGVA